ncbi:MAG: mannose-1-phosphate guanyltransferase [Kangiellaceae bacterium]|jgi:mannose-1-phosphate guanylyltransferase|nr:mannose-1-phosphate guanyltransferase [Kangiellaceae bacterium]|tara:strand:- start:9226 stop:10371 length:1146 start_codon:yes stop_codon:yes gene_type:complete
MKAMILAAGKGTRVNPLTHTTPKPLLPVKNTPVIELIIRFLQRYGVDEFAINTSHLATTIEDRLGNGCRYGANFTFSFEGSKDHKGYHPHPIGSAAGMQKIQQRWQMFDDTFIVVCGDACIDFDLSQAVAFHRARGGVATIITKTVEKHLVSRYGVVNADQAGRVRSFQEKPAPEEALSNEVNTGIYLFEPAIFDHIPLMGEFDIGGDLFPQLLKRALPVYAISPNMTWLDIGNLYDLWSVNQQAIREGVPYLNNRYRRLAPGVYAKPNVIINPQRCNLKGPIHIESGATIEDGATITGPTLIGANALVRKNNTVHQSIIEEYTGLKPHQTISKMWLGTNYAIELNTDTESSRLVNVEPLAQDSRELAQKPALASNIVRIA